MSNPSDIPLPIPGYIVYRNATDGVVDPTAPLEFFPPKDSDELFDALRAKFPHVKTHGERMRDAVIDFLLEERSLEQNLPAHPQFSASATTAAESFTTSPTYNSSFTSVSSSTFSSPELLGLAMPSFGMSPQPATLALTRQCSVATSNVGSSQPSPFALERMTGVFSLSDSSQPRQHVRRKMTEAEKIEYRKRRIVKACDKCAKRKRKCHHNESEMETIPKPPRKVVKSGASSSSTKSVATPAIPLIQATPPLSQQPYFMDVSSSLTNDLDAIDFNFLEDPVPTMRFEDLLHVDDVKAIQDPQYFHPFDSQPTGMLATSPQWPWSASADWTLMDSSLDSLSGTGTYGDSTQDGSLLYGLTPLDGWTESSSSSNSSNSNSPTTISMGAAPSDQIPGFWQGRRRFIGGRDSHEVAGNGNRGSGNEMLWEHLRTGQSSTKKALQKHAGDANHALASNAQIFDTGERSFSAGEQKCYNGLSPSLAQTTMRLTGIAKAVRTFGGLLGARTASRQSLQSISLSRVVGLVRDAQSSDSSFSRSNTGGIPPSRELIRNIGNLWMQSTYTPLAASALDAQLDLVAHTPRPDTAPSTNRGENNSSGSVSTVASPSVPIGETSLRSPANAAIGAPNPIPLPEQTLKHSVQLYKLKRRFPSTLGSLAESQTTALATTGKRLQTIPTPHRLLHPTPSSSDPANNAETRVEAQNSRLRLLGAKDTTHGAAWPGLDTDKSTITGGASGIRLSAPLHVHAATQRPQRPHFILERVFVISWSDYAGTMPYEDRLSDHFRQRDHFGRNSAFANSTRAKTTTTAATAVSLPLALIVLALAIVPQSLSALALIILATVLCSFSQSTILTLSEKKKKRSKNAVVWRNAFSVKKARKTFLGHCAPLTTQWRTDGGDVRAGVSWWSHIMMNFYLP